MLFMFYIIILILVCLDFASFSCLAGFVVLFSTRVFLIRNPYLILKEGEVHWTTFPHYTVHAKLPPSTTMHFFLGLGCVAGYSKGGSHRAISGLVFQWRVSLSIGGSVRRDPGHIFSSLASGQSSTIPHSAITILNCVIF